MTKVDKFKQFKADALRHYADYMDMIKKFSYEDLQDLKNRLILLDVYNKSVLSNAAYRNFINENTGSVLKGERS